MPRRDLDVSSSSTKSLRRLPDTELGRLLWAKRGEMLDVAKRHGAGNLRVFGSVARAEDGSESDIDMLVDLAPGTGLVRLGVMEEELEAILGREVDLVPASSLRSEFREGVLAEAIALKHSDCR